MAVHPKQTLLILGATGDLAARLLLPGLGDLLANGGGHAVTLLGCDVLDWDDQRWRRRVSESFAAGGARGAGVNAVTGSTRYRRADVTVERDWQRLLNDAGERMVIYFALPPQITEAACQTLSGVRLPPGTRLVMEKPFGHDAASAEALNDLVTRLVPEEQVHRVDHFLGMSTVLNLAGARFGNRIFDPLLSAEHVESVDIVFDETLGLEGRAAYYDRAGALVDMLQSHLLQVLSVVAMEPPSTIGERDIRDGKAAVLRAARVWNDDPVNFSYRARYTAGQVGGRELPSYVDEDGIPPQSMTETLAELVLAVDTSRWASVPFRLRSGKALGNPRQEVVFTFKQPRHIPVGFTGSGQPERLHIGIALDTARVSVDLNINGPEDPQVLSPTTFAAELGPGRLAEYGQVLRMILVDDPTLSVRGDMAVDGWRIIEPVLQAWQKNRVPLQEYPAGSTGPDAWPLSGVSPASPSTLIESRLAA